MDLPSSRGYVRGLGKAEVGMEKGDRSGNDQPAKYPRWSHGRSNIASRKSQANICRLSPRSLSCTMDLVSASCCMTSTFICASWCPPFQGGYGMFDLVARHDLRPARQTPSLPMPVPRVDGIFVVTGRVGTMIQSIRVYA